MARVPLDSRPPPRFGLAWILAITFAVYVPALFNGFTYDDTLYVKTNRAGQPPNVMVQEVRPFTEYFDRAMGWDGIEATGRGFRPITVYSYAVLHALSKTPDPSERTGFKDAPALQHIVNVLLHVLCVWLVFHMVRGISGPGWPPLIGALAFGLQPLHSDVVASMIGRGELLPFVFGAAGLLLYVRAASIVGGAKFGSLAGTVVCLFLAYCSKESAIIWCVFVPLYGWVHAWRDAGVGIWRAMRLQVSRLWAVVLPTALWVVLYVRFLGLLDGTFAVPYEYNPLYYMSAGESLPVAVMILGYGLSKVFFSVMLACDYGLAVFPLDVGWADWRTLLALALILSILGVGLRFHRRHPLLFLTAAALLGFSFVTSNIAVPIETIFGERLLFTPSVGLCFLFAWVARHPPSAPVLRIVLIGGFVAWSLWGAWWCVDRSFAWRDNNSLMLADVEHQPRSLSINKQVAVYYKDSVKPPDMAKWMHYQQRCLELDPYYIMVRNDLAAHHLSKHELERAREHLDVAIEALRLRPRYVPIQGHIVHLNMGRYHLVRGETEGAKASFRRSLELNESNPHSRDHLLMIAHEERDEDAARSLLDGFERYQRSSPLLLLHRGLQASRSGDHERAFQELGEAIHRHNLGRGRQRLSVWWAFQDAAGRMQQYGHQVQALERMLRAYGSPTVSSGLPAEDRDRVLVLLRGALMSLSRTVPPVEQAKIAARLRELRK